MIRPLAGLKIIEFEGIGPGPLAGRMLADHGAEAGAIDEAMALIETADALIEGNRPGVMERLGLGPADCAKRNPRLVYGRMTGWGQEGPLARVAAHDLNYLALSGILSLAARDRQAPIAPPTVLGDGGGALGLAFGVVAAI